MGLGPAVCQHCQVFAEYSEEPIPVVRNETTRTVSKFTHWYCPICGETDPNDYAGFSLDRYNKYHENERFLKFVKGEDPNGNSSGR
jgi:hypothetical protein